MSEQLVREMQLEMQKLRSQMSWMRRVALGVVLFAGVAFLTGQAAKSEKPALKELKVSKLTIVDAKGNTAVEFGTSKRDETYFIMRTEGKNVLNCRASKKRGSFLSLIDASGDTYATLQTRMGFKLGSYLFLGNKVSGKTEQLSTESPRRTSRKK